MNKGTKGRDWEIGDGHIGLAFKRKKIILHNNIAEELKPQPEKSCELDNFFYVSAITIPIYINNYDEIDKNAPRGVFCITSNKEGCFDNILNKNELAYNSIYKTKQDCLLLIVEMIEYLFNTVFDKTDSMLPFKYKQFEGN